MSRALCRICEDCVIDNLKNLLDEENAIIINKITSCADVTIEMDDHLPKFICNTCENNLEIAYQFRKQCEFTDSKWRIFVELQDHESYEEVSDEQNKRIKQVINLELENNQYESEDFINHQENSNQIEENNDYIIEEYINYEDDKSENYNEGNDNILVIEENKLERSQSSFSEESLVDNVEKNRINTKLKIKTPTINKIFQCDTCNEKFLSYTYFNNHKKSHGNQRYQCPKCLKWFSKRFRLKNHLIIHEENKKLFKCDKCGNTYVSQGNLDRHIRHTHNQLRPYVCTICGLGFSRSHSYIIHQAVHIEERNYECDICGKRFKSLHYLKVHKKNHIPKELRKKCSLSSSSAVSKHNKTTKKTSTSSKTIAIKDFKCQYCDKISKTKSLHLSHLHMHTGEKPFICKYCGKSFAFRPSLRVHEFVHTGEKPYECKLCGLKFRQFGHLKGHNLIHSGIKNYKCDYCDKTFSLKSNLVVHLRIHTGEQPHLCLICGKKFSDLNLFQKHQQNHNTNEKISEKQNIKEEKNSTYQVQSQESRTKCNYINEST